MKNSSKMGIKNSNILVKAFLIMFILFLMIFMFIAGMYLPGKSEIIRELAKNNTLYIGEVLGTYSEANNKIEQNVNFNLYWDVWDELKKEYVDKGKIDEKQLFYGSLEGMVNALNDPYTVFMNPEENTNFKESMSGEFEGIGAEVGIKDNVLTIIAPLDGMPAEKAGLKSGDKVFNIDGESTKNMTLNEAVTKIKGEKGTNVVLTIFRKSSNETKDITITRGVITLKSVKTTIRDDGFFIIKIINFNNNTLDEFNKAVQEVILKKPKGIIIDLRNNPGGYLDTAVEVASEWVEDGPVVIESFGKSSQKDDILYKARGIARLKDYPTVILVNQGSASASEIVAGAISDYNKGVIVGTQTYGKGSVQTIKDFQDGSSVKVTIAKWLTPNGVSISEKGIEPDVIVDYSMEDYQNNKTPQMDKAIEVLNKIIDGEKIDEMKIRLKQEKEASSTKEIK